MAPDSGVSGRISANSLAAVAPGQVARAQAGVGQQLADLLQGLVPGEVAGGVVEALEMVDVEQRHRQRLTLAPAGGDLLVQMGVDGAAVGQPGQRVVARQDFQLRIGQAQLLGALLELLAHAHQALHGAQLGAEQAGGDGLDQVVVAAGLDAAPDLVVALQAGQEDDGRPAALLGGAQMLRHPSSRHGPASRRRAAPRRVAGC
jgi:hypothetical protein